MSKLQIGLLSASIIVFLFVVKTIRSKKLNIKYSIVWIIWSISMIIISIFPEIVSWAKDFIGIEVASNMVFLIMIFLLYCMSFYVFLVISKHNDEITTLNYELASLKKMLKEKEGKNK